MPFLREKGNNKFLKCALQKSDGNNDFHNISHAISERYGDNENNLIT